MRSLIAAMTIVVGMLFAGALVQAMPLAPVHEDTGVTQVFGGCGPGWHRGPYGGCRPLYSCPPGWHTGPYGRRCFRNGW